MFLPLRDYNPTQRRAYVVILLIAINVAVFIYQSMLSEKPLIVHVMQNALIPYEITHARNVSLPVGRDSWGMPIYVERKQSPLESLVASIFMHASLLHLLGNMLFLWIFGNNVEDYLGKIKFIIFYFATGIMASLIHVFPQPNSLVPVIGASGAVSGVMGAYLLLYPTAKVRTLVFIFILITTVDIPAALFLIIWFAFQFLYASGVQGIAWLAHVGGFLTGMLLIRILRKKNRAVIDVPK